MSRNKKADRRKGADGKIIKETTRECRGCSKEPFPSQWGNHSTLKEQVIRLT